MNDQRVGYRVSRTTDPIVCRGLLRRLCPVSLGWHLKAAVQFLCEALHAYAWRAGVTAYLLFTTGPAHAAEEIRRLDPSPWEPSIVTVEVARKQYDYYQPWSRRTSRTQKSGLVIGPCEVLTTADEVFDRTLVRLQKLGRGRWWAGQVSWVDYHANLALITTTDTDFWRELKPVALGGAMPADGSLQVLRWRAGNLEARRAEFTQFTVREGQLAAVNHVVMEADCDIQNAGMGEPVVGNGHVVGLLSAQDGRNCTALPASFIQGIVDGHKQGQYRGLGYFHFYWQPSDNPACLTRLHLTGEPRGVVIIQVPDRPDGGPQVLKPEDILLNIDGFDLDMQGDYEDPEYGHLLLENLATRRKWAGDDVKLQIWRDGKPMEVNYRLPKYEYSTALVPMATYDQDPEYLILGGLVFQPLTDSYLQAWGTDWKRRAPFRLFYYRNESPSKDRPAQVLMSQVLPDAYNLGYQDQRGLVLDKVNGRRISRLPELRQALEHPVQGFHILEFARSDSLRKLVLRAGESEQEATTRVLKLYGINEPFHFAE